MLRTVKDLDLRGKRVFIRVDFNVPLKDGRITDDTRIRASLPTIKYALENGAKVIILASHLGRPKGKPDPQYSLQPVATRLSELLGQPVKFDAPVEAGFSRPDSPAGLKSSSSKTCASTPARKRTIPRTPPNLVPWRTSISTMPSDPRIARMRQPKGSSGTSKSRRRGC